MCIMNSKVIHKLYQLTPYAATTHPVYLVLGSKILNQLISAILGWV